MSVLVIYHGGQCADGFCCAWLMNRAFPGAELVPAQHGDPPPDATGKDVYVCDFSYPLGSMLRIAHDANRLVVLDHHKSAAADLKTLADSGRATVAFDLTKSGARLVWEYLYGEKPAPWLVEYVEDRDLWAWKLPHSREVNAAIRSYPLTFEAWDALALGWLEDLVPEGAAILRDQARTVDTHVRNAHEVELAGHRVRCVNATILASEIAGELATGRPFGVCYFELADGARVYSLRGRSGGVDVSEIARRFGGRGHAAAAGFAVPPGGSDPVVRVGPANASASPTDSVGLHSSAIR